MCKTIPYFIVKRVQRYDFLRTQPNNCAKIRRIMHKQMAFVQSRYGITLQSLDRLGENQLKGREKGSEPKSEPLNE